MRITNIYQLFRLSLLSMLVALMAGCAEKDSFEQPYLNVSEKEINFSGQVDEQTITVNTNCKEWIATTPKAWIHLTVNGNQIAVKADPNTTGAERSSYIEHC